MSKYHQIAGYDVVATLGKGAGSTLYAVRSPKGELFCLKRVIKKGPQDQRFLDQAVAEHQIAAKFDHPQLRKSHKVIKQRELIRVSEVVVVMEMVDGLTLEQHKPSDMLALCRICRQTAAALHAMHQTGYVHADIKPNNIMVTEDGVVKIIDFGQSCPTGTIKERIQGTPDYIAPEQVKRNAITEQTDVFCLGATMYWMLTGKNIPTLFTKRQGAGVQLKTDDYNKAVPPAEANPEVTPALSSLVMDCINRKPSDRPADMQAVIDRLDMAIAQIERNRKINGDGQADATAASSQRSARNPKSQAAGSDDAGDDLDDTAQFEAQQRRVG